MAYSDLAVTDQIILAAEFVGRGLSIPQEIQTALGPELTSEIQNPETANHEHQKRVRTRYRGGRS